MGFIGLCIRNAAAVAAMVAIAVLLGLMSIRSLPVQLFPNIERPVLGVTASWRAASPSEVEAELIADPDDEFLSAVERADFERNSRVFADALGYSVDWDSVQRLDDASLINGVAQIAPFDEAAKQALLEAPDLSARCDLLVQLMQFFSKQGGRDDDSPPTLQ